MIENQIELALSRPESPRQAGGEWRDTSGPFFLVWAGACRWSLNYQSACRHMLS